MRKSSAHQHPTSSYLQPITLHGDEVMLAFDTLQQRFGGLQFSLKETKPGDFSLFVVLMQTSI